MDAATELRRMRIAGEGTEEDYVNVYELTRLIDERDDPDAIFSLASAYYSGKGGLEPDQKAARELYSVAADRGHKGAAFNHGLMLLQGEGGEEDLEGAYSRFSQASRLGHRQALPEMGVARYRQGHYEEAIVYLELSPPDGDVWNFMFLGNAYKKLPPSAANRRRALENYKKASARGEPNAHFEVAAMLVGGDVGVDPDPDDALVYLNRALDSEVGWTWDRFRDEYLAKEEAAAAAEAMMPAGLQAGAGRAAVAKAKLAQQFHFRPRLRALLEATDSAEKVERLVEKINRRAGEAQTENLPNAATAQ